MGLSPKQRAFVEHYCATWNGAEAARLAGYSAKAAKEQASRLLTNANVQAEIESRITAIMPKGEIITRLAARGRASIADVLQLPESKQRSDGTEYTLVSDWKLDLVKAERTGGIHQIKSLKETKYGTAVEVYDPLPALELLAKQAGLMKDDGGILKYLDLSKLSQEQLQRLANGDDPIAVLLGTAANPGESPA